MTGIGVGEDHAARRIGGSGSEGMPLAGAPWERNLFYVSEVLYGRFIGGGERYHGIVSSLSFLDIIIFMVMRPWLVPTLSAFQPYFRKVFRISNVFGLSSRVARALVDSVMGAPLSRRRLIRRRVPAVTA